LKNENRGKQKKKKLLLEALERGIKREEE